MHKILGGLIWIWVGIICLFNLAGIAGAFIGNDFLTAVGKVQEWYSPFNIWTHGLNLILLSPAIATYIWLEKRRKQDEA
jgi:hypothetical protein